MRRTRGAGPARALAAATGAAVTPSSNVPMCFIRSMNDWSDDVALAAACDVLQYSGGYPTEANRRSLYKHWLLMYASGKWEDTFDELMLLCIAFTPSPTQPTEPLFGDCFKMAADGSWDPVLRTVHVRKVFNKHRLYDDEFPSSRRPDQLCDFLYDLLSTEDGEAINEAGLLIGFCSLLMCAACIEDGEAVFEKDSTPAPNLIFRTSFAGRIPCPSPALLQGLTTKTVSRKRVVVPYAAVLPVAQYVLLKKAEAAASKSDLEFLGCAFLSHTKFLGLETVDMLRKFANQIGRCIRSLNALIGGKECAESRGRVEDFLRKSIGPTGVAHISMPWCRVICCHLFEKLEVKYNVAYNLRILNFLEDDRPSSLEYLHSLPAFADITLADVSRARTWASNVRVLLSKGLFRAEGDGAPAGTPGQ